MGTPPGRGNPPPASVADEAGPAAPAGARPGVEAAPAAGAGLARLRVTQQDRHGEREIREEERIGALPPGHAHVDPGHAAPGVVDDREPADAADAAGPIAVEPAAVACDPVRARREGERERPPPRPLVDQEAQSRPRPAERAA